MNPVEKACIAIRHVPSFDKAHWFWNTVRPVYNFVVNTTARRGLQRVINGTDPLLLAPKYRGLREVYEPDLWRQLMSAVQPGDIIADVGAHIGLYTVGLAKRLGGNGRVIAFEPDEKNFRDLLHHLELNNAQASVQAVRAAVAAHDGHVYFTHDRGVENRIAVENTLQNSSVPAVTLDSFFEDRRLDILKVDVEGFEEDVLEGAELLLTNPCRAPRLIYLEVHPYNWSLCGTTSDSLLQRLRSADYEVQTLDREPCRQITTYGHVVARRQRKSV